MYVCKYYVSGDGATSDYTLMFNLYTHFISCLAYLHQSISGLHD